MFDHAAPQTRTTQLQAKTSGSGAPTAAPGGLAAGGEAFSFGVAADPASAALLSHWTESGSTAPAGVGGQVVQRKAEKADEDRAAPDATSSNETLTAAASAIDRLMVGQTVRDAVPAPYGDAVRAIAEGSECTLFPKKAMYPGLPAENPLSKVEQAQRFQTGMGGVAPLLERYRSGGPAQTDWADKARARLDARFATLLEEEAGERARNAVRTSDGKVHELSSQAISAEVAADLLPHVMSTAKIADEALKEAAAVAKAAQDSGELSKALKAAGVASDWFSAIAKGVDAYNAVIAMKKAGEGAHSGAKTLDGVKGFVDFLQASSMTLCTVVGVGAKVAGKADLAAGALGAAKALGEIKALGYITGGLEIAAGIARLVSANSAKERAEGAIGVTSGALALLGGLPGAAGGAFLGAASALFFGGGDMAGGQNVLQMLEEQKVVGGYYSTIQGALDAHDNAQDLATSETREERKAALGDLASKKASSAIGSARGFLDNASQIKDAKWEGKSFDDGRIGNSPTLRKRFAALVAAGLGSGAANNLKATRKIATTLRATLSEWPKVVAEAVQAGEERYYGG